MTSRDGLVRTLALCCLLLLAACAVPREQVSVSPANDFASVDIVDVATVIPDVALDIRYATANNFVGGRVDGYAAPKCFLHRPAAESLAEVERALRRQNLRLKVFDCYRPVRAVKHFMRWVEDTDDQRTKAEYYPSLDKHQLRGEYIAPVSGHSRAATVDLTLVQCDAGVCRELDMGTPFDFFDEQAHTDSSSVSAVQRANRHRLREAMARAGFENYPAEWWHYTFKPEPTPITMYDIEVR